MEQNEIIQMARDAGVSIRGNYDETGATPQELERFATIVATHWIETNKALAKEIIELKKQAEQEPVGYFAYDEEHDIWEELTGPNAPGATKLYAAPVRQVDLTDDEIERALDAAKVPELPDGYKSVDLEIARAVIAADREKNK